MLPTIERIVDDLLLLGTHGSFWMWDVQSVADDYARTVAEIRRYSVEAMRAMLAAEFVTIEEGGVPWSGSVDEQTERIDSEWKVLRHPDRFVWLELTPLGDAAGKRLSAEYGKRQNDFILALAGRFPWLAGSLDLDNAEDRARMTLFSLRFEMEGRGVPDYRLPLTPESMQAVLLGADDLYEASTNRTRECVARVLAVGDGFWQSRDDEEVAVMLGLLGPVLRRQLENEIERRETLTREWNSISDPESL